MHFNFHIGFFYFENGLSMLKSLSDQTLPSQEESQSYLQPENASRTAFPGGKKTTITPSSIAETWYHAESTHQQLLWLSLAWKPSSLAEILDPFRSGPHLVGRPRSWTWAEDQVVREKNEKQSLEKKSLPLLTRIKVTQSIN